MGTATYANCTDCCSPPDCNCTPPSTLYMDVSGCWSASGITLTENSGTWEQLSTIGGGIETAQVYCSGGVWTAVLTPQNASCLDDLSTTILSGTCSPFDVTFNDITLSADCCSPSGGTLTITVME